MAVYLADTAFEVKPEAASGQGNVIVPRSPQKCRFAASIGAKLSTGASAGGLPSGGAGSRNVSSRR
jgi:hypothetical protein